MTMTNDGARLLANPIVFISTDEKTKKADESAEWMMVEIDGFEPPTLCL